MAQFGFRIPDDLARQFDDYAATRGGRSEALRQLMERAIREDGAEITRPPPRPSLETGNWEGILVKLEAADFVRLDEESGAMSLTRGQWIVALVRHRLTGGRQFGAADRTRIAGIAKDIRKAASDIGRTSQIACKRVEKSADLDAPLRQLAAFKTQLLSSLEALHQAYLGNDAYWSAAPPTKKETPQA